MTHSAATSATDFPDLNQRILIAEDGEDQRNSLREVLTLSLGLAVDVAEDGGKALQMLMDRPYSVVITDLRMPHLSGQKLIEEIQNRRFPVTIIVTTAHGSIGEAVNAMRMGAFDFLAKPAEPEHLQLLVRRALQQRALQDEVALLRQRLAGAHSFKNVLSKNQRMIEIFELISQVADTNSTILIEGETGTGKEQIAQAIHQASSRSRKGSFVAINCAAVPETLLESELFGHEKGSFTGAAGQRRGRFEQADGGTLFLDEVGDVPLPMQVKLLRVLQERQFQRVGGSETLEIDVRVVAATNRSLEKMVRSGKFREDLYYRLNVIRIELPPLRERPEDIPVLAAHFIQKYRRGNADLQMSPQALDLMTAYSWPGNVRQLENALERACVTAREHVILPENLPEEVRKLRDGKPKFTVDISRPMPDQLAELTVAFEKRYLRRALKRARGNVGKCAEISGISRRSVTEKISVYQIDKDEFKKDSWIDGPLDAASLWGRFYCPNAA